MRSHDRSVATSLRIGHLAPIAWWLLVLGVATLGCRRTSTSSSGEENQEVSTRIGVSGTASNLMMQFQYCGRATGVPALRFLVINRIDKEGRGEPVCRLDRMAERGAWLTSPWRYRTTPANYRLTGCGDLQPGSYVVSAGAVGDAISHFEILPDGKIEQGRTSCPAPGTI